MAAFLSSYHDQYNELLASASSNMATTLPPKSSTSKANAEIERRKLEVQREVEKRRQQKLAELRATERALEREAEQRRNESEAQKRAELIAMHNNSKSGHVGASASTEGSKRRTLTWAEKRRRALFDDDDDDDRSSRSRSGPSTASKLSAVQQLINKSKGSGARTKSSPPTSKRSKSFNAHELIALNQEKRDRRTIEEIEMDMRARRNQERGVDTSMRTAKSASDFFASNKRLPLASTASASTASASTKKSMARSASVASTASKSGSKSTSTDASLKRKLSVTDFDGPSAKKVARSKSAAPASTSTRKTTSTATRTPKNMAKHDNDDEGLSMRDEIWRMFGHKSRAAVVSRTVYSDEEDVSSADDMEAGLEDLEREERLAERLARREELEEERREARRKLEKAKRLNKA